MALGPRLDLRQSQSLVMTPQLQQAIRLLALSNLELEAEIAVEIEKNPLLEAETGEGEEASVTPESSDPVAADTALASDAFDSDGALDTDAMNDTFHHDSQSDGGPVDSGSTSASGSLGADGPDFDAFEGALPSLEDHLMEQARAALDGSGLRVAEEIIGQLDEAGYLTISLREISERLGLPLARTEQVLAVVQGFDPAGIGARSLGECLAIQAREADRYDPAMAVLLDNLELLGEGRMAQIKRICHVDDEDLTDMIREIRGYDPKPGLRFDRRTVQTITPDLFVRQRGAKWVIELNSATLPRLLVNRRYHAELAASGSKDSRAWLSDCLASANWFVKALDQRQRTIIRVATEIVKHQRGFFEGGVSQLRPLTLRAVAEAVEMHESTISRVTSNKYLACDRGLYELKYFFSGGVAAADGGEAVSAEAVKTRIRALIAAETNDAILSDDTLVDLLAKEGHELARRTVAKYRESLGLGSSVHRRRQKSLEARAA